MPSATVAMRLVLLVALLFQLLVEAVKHADPKKRIHKTDALLEFVSPAIHNATTPLKYATIGANGLADTKGEDVQQAARTHQHHERKAWRRVRQAPQHLPHLRKQEREDAGYLGAVTKKIFPSRSSTVLDDMFKWDSKTAKPKPPADSYTDMEGNPTPAGDGYDGGYDGYAGDATDGVVDDDVDVSVGTEVVSAKGSLDVPSVDTWTMAPEPTLWAIGDGVGSLAYDRSPTDSRTLNRLLRQRLQIQDYATISVVMTIFFLTILVSLRSIYQVSDDPSPVLFYSDAKYPLRRCMCATADSEAFLQAFNGQPTNAKLRLIGKRAQEESLRSLIYHGRVGGAVRRLGDTAYEMFDTSRDARQWARSLDSVLFDVTLDLTPFIQGEGQLRGEDDQIELQKYLGNRSNPLELILLRKHVEWQQWEDIATNIKQRLRHLGFQGDLEIHLDDTEDVIVFRNDPWQNFVRSRITQALIVISVLGAFFWVPYVWARNKKRTVHTYFQIGVDGERFWELFSQGLHPTEGFTAN